MKYRIATLNECEDMHLKHLDWDADKDILITDDISLLSEECAAIGSRLTIAEGKLQILVPIMESDELVNDDDLNMDDLENKNVEPDLAATLKEYIDKGLEEIDKNLQNSLKEYIDKNKLVTEDTLREFAIRLKNELNERFDEIRRPTSQEEKEGRSA